jgi:hypothetical protein
MDHSVGLTSRWGKRYFRSGSAATNEESKYLLDGEDEKDVAEVFSSSVRGRKVKEEDFEADELLVSVPGRPPARPPNDQVAVLLNFHFFVNDGGPNKLRILARFSD